MSWDTDIDSLESMLLSAPPMPSMGANDDFRSSMWTDFGDLGPQSPFSPPQLDAHFDAQLSAPPVERVENTALPPSKKRKRTEEVDPLKLMFTPLQPAAWPQMESIHAPGVPLTNALHFEPHCQTELSNHQSTGALIHYKRNQIHFTFSLTMFAPMGVGLDQLRVQGSDLCLDNLHVDLQIVESPSLLVNEALENPTSGSSFVDRPGTLAGSPDALKQIPFPLVRKDAVQHEVQERMYFERATAANGNAKKQCYFYILVSLCASNAWSKCALQTFVSVQPLIVRGGNPGSYKKKDKASQDQTTSPLSDSTVDSSPETHSSPASTTSSSNQHEGWRSYDGASGPVLYAPEWSRVGINNNDPHEALSVRGNIEMTGHLMRPSDRRIKSNFKTVDVHGQLERIRAVQLYDYERQDLATGEWVPERGVIAQELAQVMPNSVQVKGDIVLPNGQTIQDFCTVNERDLMIEHLGATQALATQVDRLEQAQESLLTSMKSAALDEDYCEESNPSWCGYLKSKALISVWCAIILLLLIGGVFFIHTRRQDGDPTSPSDLPPNAGPPDTSPGANAPGHTGNPGHGGPVPSPGPPTALNEGGLDWYGALVNSLSVVLSSELQNVSPVE